MVQKTPTKKLLTKRNNKTVTNVEKGKKGFQPTPKKGKKAPTAATSKTSVSATKTVRSSSFVNKKDEVESLKAEGRVAWLAKHQYRSNRIDPYKGVPEALVVDWCGDKEWAVGQEDLEGAECSDCKTVYYKCSGDEDGYCENDHPIVHPSGKCSAPKNNIKKGTCCVRGQHVPDNTYDYEDIEEVDYSDITEIEDGYYF